MKKSFKNLAILSLTLFVFSCKKDNELDVLVGSDDGKIPFETVYKTTEYSVNINPAATIVYTAATNQDKQVFTNGIITDVYKKTNYENFVWLVKPVANTNWVYRPSTKVLIQWNDEAFAQNYMLDQVLLPSDSQGASAIYPIENTPTSITSPLKVNVELWKSKFIAPMVAASEVDKGASYTKQTEKGKLLETRTLTFNAEKLDLILPATFTKNQTIDLRTLLDSSVKTTGDNLPLFNINGINISGYNYTVPSTAGTLTIWLTKKYANGYYGITKTVNVI